MKQLSVGSIVESVCGKCNDVMGHTIMAMVSGEIVKVECRVCKSQHRYRPPARVPVGGKSTVTMKKGREGEPVDNRQAAVARATRPAMPKSASKKSSAAVIAAQAALESWQAMMLKREGDVPRSYNMTEGFAVGDLIDHPAFGRGQVRGVTPPDKMDVLFQSGIKRLVQNKK